MKKRISNNTNPHKLNRNKLLRSTSNGFTIIEMLIVLAMIAVLSGALISLLNPSRQFEKAETGAISGITTKIVTSIESYYAVFGEYPTCEVLMDEIDGAEVLEGCAGSDVNQGTFRVPGLNMANDCSPEPAGVGGAYGSGGGSTCAFRYEYDDGAESACLGVRFPEDTDGNDYLLWIKDLSTPTRDTNGLETGEFLFGTYQCDEL